MNLTDANQQGSEVDPVWFELYQAKQEYKLTDLTPQSMDDLFHRMKADDALFQLYYKCVKGTSNKILIWCLYASFYNSTIGTTTRMRMKPWQRAATIVAKPIYFAV
jgi:hypothetical protein